MSREEITETVLQLEKRLEQVEKRINYGFPGPLDCSYFRRLGKQESLHRLAELQQSGNLPEFILEVAPDYYISPTEVMCFTLAIDIGLLE